MVNTRILIFLFLIVCSIVKCSVYSDCENGVNPSEKNECVDRIDKDKKEQGYHCCFRKNYEYDETTNYECDLFFYILRLINLIIKYKINYIKDY